MNIHRIVVSANFTIEPLSRAVKVFLDKLGIVNEIVIAPYNQVFQQLVDTSSLFYGNTQGINAIFLRIEDLIDGKAVDFKYGETEFETIRSNAAEFSFCLRNASGFSVPLFIFICPRSVTILNEPAFVSGFDDIEKLLINAAERIPNVFILKTDHLFKRYSIGNYDNPKGNSLGHIPYSDEFFSALGTEIARKIDAHLRRPHKVIVLDCDNTLWDGVCGEDGTDGIGFCESRLFLQKLVVEQSKAGMLICLCSKNNEADVWEVFDQRPEMLLRREHLVSSRINWHSKSSNLKSLAQELHLGLDSFIFIDDDSVVCAEVKTNCPEVLTVQIPSSIGDLPKFLEHLWVFDRLKVTEEDRDRTQSYRRQVERNKLQAETSNLAAFLDNLQLVVDISDMTAEQVPRVSQLSLRTNQFNSTTIRRSEAEIQGLRNDPRIRVRTISVRDRFGDYGLVGVVILEDNIESIDVRSFMLSCRVLGRGVEHAIVRDLGSMGNNASKRFINIEYCLTAKNSPFLNFVTEIGENKVVNGENSVCRIPVQKAENLQPRDGGPLPDPRDNNEIPVNTQDSDQTARHDVYVEIANILSQPGPTWLGTNSSDIARTKLSSNFVAARTETEFKLANIWEKVLSLKNIGVFDNFFELGGDSIVAVSLFVEIENNFDVSLPLSALINSPTIEKLAGLIKQDPSGTEWKYLVPIQTDGAQPPLFCFHAAGGNVLFYRDLAYELGSDQPVYGLQARGVANKAETAHDRVEDMAMEYLNEIRSLWPEGPYRICGSSFGGLVAFEAALQLSEIGEEVDVLALFDTYAPGYLQADLRSGARDRMNSILERFSNAKNQLGEIRTVREQIQFIFERMNKLKTRLKRKVVWQRNEFAIQYNQTTGRELPVDIQRNHKAIAKAEDSYHPRFYEGQMVLLRASGQPRNTAFDPFLGWGKHTGQKIKTEVVKGIHGSLTVYPFAADLAAKLTPFLSPSKVLEADTVAARARA